MIFSPLEKLLMAMVSVLVIGASIAGWLWQREIGKRHQTALRADSLAAALDTSHAIVLSRKDSIKILGDTIQAVGRRAFQTKQVNDALDRALGLQRAAIAELGVQVRDLRTTVTSSGGVHVDTVTGARSATFHVEPDTTDPTRPPYSGTATALLPVSGPGTLDLHLSLPRASIGLRLGCGAPTDGVRSASATLTGPPWMQLELGRVDQSPEVCNPTNPPGNWLKRLLSHLPKCGLGGAAIVAEDRQGHAGVGVMCIAWP